MRVLFRDAEDNVCLAETEFITRMQKTVLIHVKEGANCTKYCIIVKNDDGFERATREALRTGYIDFTKISGYDYEFGAKELHKMDLL